MGNRSKRAVTLLGMDQRQGVCRGNSREKSGGDSLDPCENISWDLLNSLHEGKKQKNVITILHLPKFLQRNVILILKCLTVYCHVLIFHHHTLPTRTHHHLKLTLMNVFLHNARPLSWWRNVVVFQAIAGSKRFRTHQFPVFHRDRNQWRTPEKVKSKYYKYSTCHFERMESFTLLQ